MAIRAKTKKELEKEIERAKENLGDLENYIEDLSTFLPLGVCNLTPMGIIIDVNNTFKELTGFKASEIAGEKLETLFSEKKEVRRIIKEAERNRNRGNHLVLRTEKKCRQR